MSRLVVVSNRVTLPDEERAGGLAIALRAALAEHGGLWFGWSGKRVRGESGEMHLSSHAGDGLTGASRLGSFWISDSRALTWVLVL